MMGTEYKPTIGRKNELSRAIIGRTIGGRPSRLLAQARGAVLLVVVVNDDAPTERAIEALRTPVFPFVPPPYAASVNDETIY